jgi:hypothetical protein
MPVTQLLLGFNSIASHAAIAYRIDPDGNCGIVPPELRYNAVTNPTGVRCTVYDHTVNVYDRDPATGFARRPLDNEGLTSRPHSLARDQCGKSAARRELKHRP